MRTRKKAQRTAPKRVSAKTRGARRTKAAAGKAPNPAFAFLTDFMTRNPKAVYADAAAAAAEAGHKIYPIMWGRAQALMGRVKSKPRGSGKAAVATRAASAAKAGGRKAAAAAPRGAKRSAAKRSVGRPRKTATAAANGAFPVAEGDLPRMAALVDALNAGGKAVLRYAGDGWELAVDA